MKDYYQKIKNIFRREAVPGRGLGLDIDIPMDWKILCVVFLILVGLALAVDINVFYLAPLQSAGETQAGTSTLTLNKNKLDKIVGEWTGREETFNKILGGRSDLIDPSR